MVHLHYAIGVMKLLAKPIVSGMVSLFSLFFIVSFPSWLESWVQLTPGFDPKAFEWLGTGAITVFIVFYIFQIVKLFKPGKEVSTELAVTLVKVNLALDNIVATQARQLTKEDTILLRLEEAKIAMAAVPEVHKQLAEMSVAALRSLGEVEKALVAVVKNQESTQDSLDRIENNQE